MLIRISQKFFKFHFDSSTFPSCFEFQFKLVNGEKSYQIYLVDMARNSGFFYDNLVSLRYQGQDFDNSQFLKICN